MPSQDSPKIIGIPIFSAYLSADQTGVVSGTPTKVHLDTVDIDTHSFFDNVTNFRFQPTVAGYYEFYGVVSVDDIDDGDYVIAYLYKNGAEHTGRVNLSPAANQVPGATVMNIILMNGSTDYVELYGLHNQGSNQAFDGVSDRKCMLTAKLLARV